MASNLPHEKMEFLSPSSNSNFSDLEGDLNSSIKTTQQQQQQQLRQNQQTAAHINMTTTSSGGAAGVGGVGLGIGSNGAELGSTLDEPVSVTVRRDLQAVGYKLAHVFYPKKSNMLLRDWDLWGPLSLCVLLSISLKGDNSGATHNAPEFASVFAMITLGAIVVTLNTKLLSGKISFFQSICVLGYCLLPLVLVALLSDLLIMLVGIKSVVAFAVRFGLVGGACAWSVFASTAFLAADTINLADRKALAIYPIFLFYFVISWLIVLDTN